MLPSLLTEDREDRGLTFMFALSTEESRILFTFVGICH